MRPMVDDASTWVQGRPESTRRFAATLTRAKLDGHFTDTVFSFRATRTIFRPYQFKPVLKLLDTGTLRLLIADEVGLGKTIEAGLVWTEMEARRQADRVLVVCPSSLVAKWKREMEERFGFDCSSSSTTPGLADLLDRLETDRVPRRAAYICSIERLRMWEGIERATELGLQFDLSIVDEAHAFRNSDTRSYELGEQHPGLVGRDGDVVGNAGEPAQPRSVQPAVVCWSRASSRTSSRWRSASRPTACSTGSRSHCSTRRRRTPHRRAGSRSCEHDVFGLILTLRPDSSCSARCWRPTSSTPPTRSQIKRLCAELHGLSAR